MKFAVIGAGISGVSAARMLQDKGHEVTVFEKGTKPGGLVRCDVVDGHLFHRTGGHIFNAKDKEVRDWFWSYFDKEKEFISARRNAKILLKGKVIGYPIENYLYQLDKEIIESVLADFLTIGPGGKKDPFSYSDFADFLKGNFGSTLYQLYFEPYNRKIWNTDLSQVPLGWLEGKLPMPNIKQVLLSNLLREEESSMVHSTFYYPRQGGSQFIIERLATGLDIQCNREITKLEFKSGIWTINETNTFDSIVFTGDVRQLSELMSIDDRELQHELGGVSNLRSNGTSNLLCETDDTDVSWLYLPDGNTRAHRIIYTGNFSASNNAKGKRKSCVVEFSGHVDERVMKAEIASLPGNLAPIDFNYEPNSYVIQSEDTRARISRIKNILSGYRFHLSGRFAEWEYYNMDKAIFSVMDILKSFRN
jgi:protoporphyrinogen oxidase